MPRKEVPDYINEHMRSIVLLITKAGEQVAVRNHYAAMWSLWALIPKLDVKTREKFISYKDEIPKLNEGLRQIKGFNWSMAYMKKNGFYNLNIVPMVEELYWSIYQALVDEKYFDMDKRYGPSMAEIDFSKAEEQ